MAVTGDTSSTPDTYHSWKVALNLFFNHADKAKKYVHAGNHRLIDTCCSRWRSPGITLLHPKEAIELQDCFRAYDLACHSPNPLFSRVEYISIYQRVADNVLAVSGLVCDNRSIIST